MTNHSEPGGHGPPPPLHELEAEVMDVVWSLDEASVRDVMASVNASTGRDRAYTTFMTIMGRLDGKGMLERRRDGKTDLYTATHSREQYADLRAQAELESVVDQYGEVALAHIARRMAALDPQRRRALQRLARKG